MKNTAMIGLAGGTVGIAAAAVLFLVFRGDPETPDPKDRGRAKVVANEPSATAGRDAAPKRLGDKRREAERAASPAPKPPPSPPPPELGEGEIARAIEEILREYDNAYGDVVMDGTDSERVMSLKGRSEKIEKLVAKLAALGPNAIPLLIEAIRRDVKMERQQLVIRGLAKMGTPDAVRALADSLVTMDAFGLKLTIVNQIAEHGGPAGLEALSARLSVEPDFRIRGAILRQLGHLKAPDALSVASRVAREDENPNVRQAALRAIGEIKDPTSGPVIEELIRTSTDIAVKQTAIQVYGIVLGEQALPLLEDLLRNEPNVRVKATVIAALKEVGTEQATAVLERTANDPGVSEDVRARARGELAKLEAKADAGGTGSSRLPSEGGIRALEDVKIDKPAPLMRVGPKGTGSGGEDPGGP